MMEPLGALASTSRKEPAPLSLALVTISGAGRVRSSNGSSLGRTKWLVDFRTLGGGEQIPHPVPHRPYSLGLPTIPRLPQGRRLPPRSLGFRYDRERMIPLVMMRSYDNAPRTDVNGMLEMVWILTKGRKYEIQASGTLMHSAFLFWFFRHSSFWRRRKSRAIPSTWSSPVPLRVAELFSRGPFAHKINQRIARSAGIPPFFPRFSARSCFADFSVPSVPGKARVTIVTGMPPSFATRK